VGHGGRDARSPDGGRAAGHAPPQAWTLEEGQVAADGLGGHVEALRELSHLDASVLARLGENLLLPLRRVHEVSVRKGDHAHSDVAMALFTPVSVRRQGLRPDMSEIALLRARTVPSAQDRKSTRLNS